MKNTTTLLLFLISTSFAIKIKIRTPKATSPTTGGDPTGGWKVKRGCRKAAPNVKMGSLFSLYAEQLYNIFNDPINELLLVRHEAQVVAGMNRRFIFRVRDKQTGDVLYIGMSIYVDLQGAVRITGYLESFDIDTIVNALGFSGRKQFRYRCGEMNADATAGFEAWANSLISGGGFSQGGTGSFDNTLDNFDNFGSTTTTTSQPTNYGTTSGFQNQFTNNYQPQPVPQVVTQPVPQVVTQPVIQHTSDPFGGSDSPFEEKTININITGRNPDGSKFLIGSSRPKRGD